MFRPRRGEFCVRHFFLSFFLFFNWNMLALQCYVSFFCTAKWINHVYTYILSLLNLPPIPPCPPLGHHRTMCWAPCAIQQVPAICFTNGGVYVSVLLFQFVHPLLPPLCSQVCSVGLCLYSCPPNRLINTIFLFSFFLNFILFLNFTILYWFWQILKWIHHRHICVPHPEPSSLPIPSLGVVPVHQSQASSIVHRTWTGDSFHTWYYTCFNVILPNLPTLSLSHRVHKTVLYISVSFAVSYTGLLLPSF